MCRWKVAACSIKEKRLTSDSSLVEKNSEIETEDENLSLDSARNSFSQALKGYVVDERRPVREPRLPCCGIGLGWFLIIERISLKCNGKTAVEMLQAHRDKDVKAPNVFERIKEEFEAVLHGERHSHHHHKETHGLRKDIDENTPVSDVKAPNVFERAKEEIEALVQAIHPKKKDHGHSSNGINRTNGTTAELKHMPDSLSGLNSMIHLWQIVLTSMIRDYNHLTSDQ